MTKNVPGANVVTRSSTRNAAAATNSDRIVGAAAKEKVAKDQQHPQAKASDAAAQATDQEIPSVSRDRAPRNKPDASKDPAKRASLAPGHATDSAPRPTTEVKSGAVPVSRAARCAKKPPRGDGGGDSPPVAGIGLGIDYGGPVPDQNLGAGDQARSEDRAPEHMSETGASKGTKRSSQDAENDNSPPATGKRARKSTGRPRPTGEIGAPSKAPSEDPEHETPPPGPSRGKRFGDILLRVVVINRTLRETYERYEKYHRRVVDLDRQIEKVREEYNINWFDEASAERDIDKRIKSLEAQLEEPNHNKASAGRKKQYLLHQRRTCIHQLRSLFNVTREDFGLEPLVGDHNLWRGFLYFRTTIQRITDLDLEIAQSKRELKALENATEWLYRRVFEFGDNEPVPARAEASVFGNMDDLPGVIDRIEDLEHDKPQLERLMNKAALRVLASAEEAFVSSGVLVHVNVLYNRNGFRHWNLHEQEDPPHQRYSFRYEPRGDYPGRYSPVRDAHAPERHDPDDRYGRVIGDGTGENNQSEEEDPPEQENSPQQDDQPKQGNRSEQERLQRWQQRHRGENDEHYYEHAPDRLAPDSRTPARRHDGHVPSGHYIDQYGRVRKDGMGDQNSPRQEDRLEHLERGDRYRRRCGGRQGRSRDNDESVRDNAPAEPSVRKLGERFDLAKRNLQKARAEFEGARTLIQSEIRDLPPPVTEDAKGVAAAQKLIRRTRALTDAIQEYKATYERARKAGLTEGGEKTADFSDREDDGYTEEVWAEIKAAGKARVPKNWDGLHIVPREATPTRRELDLSLMMLLSPRLGEDAHHLAAASTRYREAIDALIMEGHNLREASSFPEAEADEPVVAGPVVEEPVADEPVVDEPVVEEPAVDEPVVE
jgi:hypothetical protein